jgi:hypothetical protein
MKMVVWIGKYFDIFFIQNGLKPDAVTSAFQFAIWKVQANQEGLKVNGTHQLLVSLTPLAQHLVGQGLLNDEASQSHTLQSIGLLWMIDQPIADLYMTTQLTRDKYPCPHWNSNPQSQLVSRHRPLP